MVVGSGTGVPSVKRASPSYLLRLSNQMLLVDLGPGTLRRLAELEVRIQEIDGICCTHFHPDHIADLVHFFFASKNPMDPRKKPLTLFAAPKIRSFYDELLYAYEGVFRPDFPFSIVTLEDSQHDEAHFRLFTLPILHTPHSIGFRFESEGKVVVFSGDTDVCDNLVTLAHGADLFVLECSFPDSMKVQGHLVPKECGQLAQKAEVKRLLLSHFYPPCEGADLVGACKKFYTGEILLASDGLRVRV